ncbi:RluA family pseudouridine synthase [Thioalkalivibrio sulfidiphilus]|uniref:Pseudouridine synthase n=1 Tax=Thioalkalivibrio sulfidiphilus (strain HL-EbGR7) TaxID=396588 RepID=B8GR19_THISH|nr:RluA family pseudouridine synthase [Thioalkalivibrio sulfidiphilus]ACL72439.1 pseudouridine synthase, RluA family [Thioalkalivibrio sulfidiphilus HL-EbGr7]
MKTADSPPSKVTLVRVGSGQAGQRLDNFLLGQLKGVPKSHVYRLLRKGEVRVNKGRAKPEYRLQEGDQVRIPPVRQAASPPDDSQMPLPGELAETLRRAVLLEDEDLLVLNKPAGLAVHGGSGVKLGLIEAMRRLRPRADFLELAHRLDRETSGCLVLAKRREALLAFHEALKSGGVDKHYVTLLAGVWQGGPRRISETLARKGPRTQVRKVEVDEDGKHAESFFFPRRHFVDATLMGVEIGTGRTHQIRVHAAHEGFPVAGDSQYGDFEFNRRMKRLGLKRQFLHAETLRFHLPGHERPYQIQAPLPADLEAVLERLEPLDV